MTEHKTVRIGGKKTVVRECVVACPQLVFSQRPSLHHVQVYRVECHNLGGAPGHVWKRYSSIKTLTTTLPRTGLWEGVWSSFNDLLVGWGGLKEWRLGSDPNARQAKLQHWFNGLLITLERNRADFRARRLVESCFSSPDWTP